MYTEVMTYEKRKLWEFENNGMHFDKVSTYMQHKKSNC